jgi:S-adenosylmethionine:tRNA ribosyltransferase-isomerase
LIAQTPLDDRAASRLLVLRRETGAIEHRVFREAPILLSPGDLLVLNDTRVSGVRLEGRRRSGGVVETLLLERLATGRYRALVRPAKRLRIGEQILFDHLPDAVVVLEEEEGIRVLDFAESTGLDEKLDEFGSVPLPPYIHERLTDRERYQTVYGESMGSAAAPTAGLHFTPEILDSMTQRGVGIAKVTLHVGIDTFRPVQVDDVDEHRMHGERCIVPSATAQMIENCEGRIIAVGTTTVRTLETMAVGPREVAAGESMSRLFIKPGYSFRVVDGMFTNFHLPRTTMLLMISAMAGRERVFAAYEDAKREKYRFLSFGDSMLII